MVKVAAIVLAAGTSSRFSQGSTKLVANFEGKPLVRHAVDAAMASLAFPVVVVTGHMRKEIRTAVHGAEAVYVHNDDYATGIASSLRSGLASLPSNIDGAVICLADMPRVTSSLIDLLIVSFGRTDRAHAIVPVHNRRRGNPVLVARALFEPIATLTGDEGAKRFLNQPNTKVVEALVEDAGVLADIDTSEALDALSSRSPVSTIAPERNKRRLSCSKGGPPNSLHAAPTTPLTTPGTGACRSPTPTF